MAAIKLPVRGHDASFRMVRNKQSYFVEPDNIHLCATRHYNFGKLLRPMEDGDHINVIYH